MNKEIDTKKVNQLLRISSKILKKMYILIFIIAIYISILILNKPFLPVTSKPETPPEVT